MGSSSRQEPNISEHDQARFIVIFEDHPTHLILIHLWKDYSDPTDNGFLFEADAKNSTSREKMDQTLKKIAVDMAVERIAYSQLPVFDAARKAMALASGQTTVTP